MILGHWGEVAAFWLDRIDRMRPIAGLPQPDSAYFADHVYLTSGGVLSERYLRWATEVVGVDRIVFAADYPYVPTAGAAARRFLDAAGLSDVDREKIASGNWERLRSASRR